MGWGDIYEGFIAALLPSYARVVIASTEYSLGGSHMPSNSTFAQSYSFMFPLCAVGGVVCIAMVALIVFCIGLERRQAAAEAKQPMDEIEIATGTPRATSRPYPQDAVYSNSRGNRNNDFMSSAPSPPANSNKKKQVWEQSAEKDYHNNVYAPVSHGSKSSSARSTGSSAGRRRHAPQKGRSGGGTASANRRGGNGNGGDYNNNNYHAYSPVHDPSYGGPYRANANAHGQPILAPPYASAAPPPSATPMPPSTEPLLVRRRVSQNPMQPPAMPLPSCGGPPMSLPNPLYPTQVLQPSSHQQQQWQQQMTSSSPSGQRGMDNASPSSTRAPRSGGINGGGGGGWAIPSNSGRSHTPHGGYAPFNGAGDGQTPSMPEQRQLGAAPPRQGNGMSPEPTGILGRQGSYYHAPPPTHAPVPTSYANPPPHQPQQQPRGQSVMGAPVFSEDRFDKGEEMQSFGPQTQPPPPNAWMPAYVQPQQYPPLQDQQQRPTMESSLHYNSLYDDPQAPRPDSMPVESSGHVYGYPQQQQQQQQTGSYGQGPRDPYAYGASNASFNGAGSGGGSRRGSLGGLDM